MKLLRARNRPAYYSPVPGLVGFALEDRSNPSPYVVTQFTDYDPTLSTGPT
jgi:hypothetical protein